MDPKQIGPIDTQLTLQAAVTKTATFNSAAIDLGSGFNGQQGAGRPMTANLRTSAVDTANTDETYKFKIQDSADNNTFTDRSPDFSVTGAGAFSVGAFVVNRYVRLVATLGGTTPSITYECYLSPYHVGA